MPSQLLLSVLDRSICSALCRSLGDAELKDDGLISAPEVTQQQLTDADEFLILASDGLWERMSNEQACGLVHDTVKEAGMAAKRYASGPMCRAPVLLQGKEGGGGVPKEGSP